MKKLLFLCCLLSGCGDREPPGPVPCNALGYSLDWCEGAKPVCEEVGQEPNGLKHYSCTCGRVNYEGAGRTGNSCGLWLVHLPSETCYEEQPPCPE